MNDVRKISGNLRPANLTSPTPRRGQTGRPIVTDFSPIPMDQRYLTLYRRYITVHQQ